MRDSSGGGRITRTEGGKDGYRKGRSSTAPVGRTGNYQLGQTWHWGRCVWVLEGGVYKRWKNERKACSREEKGVYDTTFIIISLWTTPLICERALKNHSFSNVMTLFFSVVLFCCPFCPKEYTHLYICTSFSWGCKWRCLGNKWNYHTLFFLNVHQW